MKAKSTTTTHAPQALTFKSPPLFFKEEWRPLENGPGPAPVSAANVANRGLEIRMYGPDAKNLMIYGAVPNEADQINVWIWNGHCTAPVAVTLRDKNKYVDLSGLARVRWTTRSSGFNVVRPVVKLADGRLLVGDYMAAATTTFLESEFSFTGMRWIKLDPERVVTTGVYGPVGEASVWVDHPDLNKVDEVGFADLMPGSGSGAGGWINVARLEVYGKPVKR